MVRRPRARIGKFLFRAKANELAHRITSNVHEFNRVKYQPGQGEYSGELDEAVHNDRREMEKEMKKRKGIRGLIRRIIDPEAALRLKRLKQYKKALHQLRYLHTLEEEYSRDPRMSAKEKGLMLKLRNLRPSLEKRVKKGKGKPSPRRPAHGD